jgi:hypothetical protein
VPITMPSDRENTAVRQSPGRAQRGESCRANRPTSWSSSVSVPAFSTSFDSEEPRCTSHTVPKM